jgi:hypothetical protein
MAVPACKGSGHKVDPTMFPDAQSNGFPLHRCMRVLPHHQDTGGFFIAVLQKTAPIDAIDPVSLAHRCGAGKQAGRQTDRWKSTTP